MGKIRQTGQQNKNSDRTTVQNNKPDRRTVQTEIEGDALSPTWSFANLDIGGPWCWSATDLPTVMHLLAELKQFETMNWVDIRATGSHNIQTFKIIKKAQNRLKELHLDEYDELYSYGSLAKRECSESDKRVFSVSSGGIQCTKFARPSSSIPNYSFVRTCHTTLHICNKRFASQRTIPSFANFIHLTVQ
jgi:hypothetical protein